MMSVIVRAISSARYSICFIVLGSSLNDFIILLVFFLIVTPPDFILSCVFTFVNTIFFSVYTCFFFFEQL